VPKKRWTICDTMLFAAVQLLWRVPGTSKVTRLRCEVQCRSKTFIEKAENRSLKISLLQKPKLTLRRTGDERNLDNTVHIIDN
jgi:hypothetical protein